MADGALTESTKMAEIVWKAVTLFVELPTR